MIRGRETVSRATSAPRYEHLHAEIVPGVIEDRGDRFLAQLLTILRWRSSGATVDISRQTLAIIFPTA